MIWHIFKKDLRRLWPFVLGLALADFVYATLHIMFGLFPADHPLLENAAAVLDILISGLSFFLVAAAVQLDPVPEDRQDWLARPIKRRDLLLSKLLFAIVCVHGPLFAASLFEGLGSGLTLGQAGGNALSWTLYRFVSISTSRFPGTIFALALAAATQSIGQMLAVALAAGIGTVMVAIGLAFAIYGQDGGSARYQFAFAQWGFSLFVILASAAAVLALQYFRRATKTAYVVIGLGSFFLWASFALVDQSTALALQSGLSSAPGRDVSVSFTSDAPKRQVSVMGNPEMGFLVADGYTPIYLPLRVTNISPGLMLVAEDLRAKFTTADGTSDTYRTVLNLPIQVPGQAGLAMPLYQVLWVPPDFYRNHADQRVRVNIDISFGVLRPLGTYEIAPVRGTVRTPDGISCATRNNPNRAIQLSCLQPANLPVRVTAGLFDHASGRRNPAATRFMYSDAPYAFDDDMIVHFGSNLPFRAADTGAPYPVGPAQLATSSVVLTTSKPLTHFMRHITIPNLRLNEWKTEIPGG